MKKNVMKPKYIFSLHFQMLTQRKYTVNIHFVRCCNYHCKFCFHRGCEDNTTLSNGEWENVIDNISRSPLVKRINFAGGEPFMVPGLAKRLIKCAKQKGLETSVITNASMFSNKIFNDIKDDLDMIGISEESGCDEVNYKIGRCSRVHSDKEPTHLESVRRVANLCKLNHVYLKLNTVICRENLHDDSIFNLVNEIQPQRWKVFRVLKIDNENGVDKDERTPYTGFITDDEWNNWKKECQEKCSITPKFENNDDMLTSYLMVDEAGYLLDSSSGSKIRRKCLLNSEFSEIMKNVGFDEEKFISRGGNFNICQVPDIEDIGGVFTK